MPTDDRVHLEEELARARAQVVQLRGELDRLRARRAVKVALGLASLAKPVFQLVRGEGRTAKRPSRAVTPVKVPEVLDRGLVERRADIVVCVHNARDDVERCLSSIAAHTELGKHRLIVVDDGSGEETANLVVDTADDLGATRIRHEQAGGYTVAAAAGIAAGDAPFVVLLNSDTVVTPGWLDRMMEVVADDKYVAVVGPWSNAASWQSIPELTEADGSWKVNQLADGETTDDVAAAVATETPLRPDIALVNGFCYLLRRSAYDAVGGLDTERFPRGYGEEDDLSLRLSAAGYRLRVADDVYVHHAKSKSFTPEGRAKIVQTSKQVLRDKHGDAVTSALDELQHDTQLVRARTWAALRVLASRRGRQDPPQQLADGPSIAWVQPHLEQVGGIRRAITMTNLMRSWGARPTLITPDGRRTTWLSIDSDVLSITEAAGRDFDVVVVSDPDMVDMALRVEAGRRVVYHLAAYARYRPKDDLLTRFYELGGLHLANSRWTADEIEKVRGEPVDGIVPGAADPAIFHPVGTPRTHDVVCYGSDRAHKGTATIVEATRRLRLLKLVDLHLPQGSLATGICSGKVFVSGAWHEGFNMPPLEAMACGVPVVMTDDGGSRDYAVDGHNALVVPVKDAKAMRRGIERVMQDQELRTRLVHQGLRTAFEYHWDQVTRTFVDLVLPG